MNNKIATEKDAYNLTGKSITGYSPNKMLTYKRAIEWGCKVNTTNWSANSNRLVPLSLLSYTQAKTNKLTISIGVHEDGPDNVEPTGECFITIKSENWKSVIIEDTWASLNFNNNVCDYDIPEEHKVICVDIIIPAAIDYKGNTLRADYIDAGPKSTNPTIDSYLQNVSWTNVNISSSGLDLWVDLAFIDPYLEIRD